MTTGTAPALSSNAPISMKSNSCSTQHGGLVESDRVQADAREKFVRVANPRGAKPRARRAGAADDGAASDRAGRRHLDRRRDAFDRSDAGPAPREVVVLARRFRLVPACRACEAARLWDTTKAKTTPRNAPPNKRKTIASCSRKKRRLANSWRRRAPLRAWILEGAADRASWRNP